MTTLILSLLLSQQNLPEAPGRAETEKLCKGCHEISRSVSKRQDRDAWLITMNRMSAFGMKSTDAEFKAVLAYLAAQYPAEDIPRVNVNTAKAIELESALGLRRSQANALIAYRTQNGPFKALEDLKKVTQIDFAKLEEKKDRITF